jgi:hypothetical protein
MVNFRLAFPPVFVFFLAACASPTIQYTKLPVNISTRGMAQNPQGWQKFRFAHSMISIANTPQSGYTSVAVLVDSPTDAYYTGHGSSKVWGVKTDIGFKYKANTQLLDAADISMQDNRIKLIDDVGAIAGAVLPLLGAGGPSDFPMTIAMDPFLTDAPPNDANSGVVCHDDDNRVRSCSIPEPSKA